MASKTPELLKSLQLLKTISKDINCRTAGITTRNRKNFIKTYPTVLQFPDGSTINIQYPEPVEVIRLPLDLSTLSEEERKVRLEKRIPKTKVKIEDDIEDEFDESRYLKYKKK